MFKENTVFVYPDRKFTVSLYKKFTDIFDGGIATEYKTKDNTYKIHGVQGHIDFPNNVDGCYKKLNEIDKEISSMFGKTKKKNWGIFKIHLKGKAAEGSTYNPITFDFDNGDRLNISCYHYSDAPGQNHLKMSLSSKEMVKYTSHSAEAANN